MWVLGLCIRVKWPHGLWHATSGDISNTGHIFLNSNKVWPVNNTSVPRRRELVCKLICVHTTVTLMLSAVSSVLKYFRTL